MDNIDNLESEFEKETGKDAWVENSDYGDYYSFDFVNWLADKIVELESKNPKNNRINK